MTTEQLKLVAWSELHAALVCIGAAVSVAGGWPLFLPVLAAGSFAILIWRFRFTWTATGRFGLANGVTLARLIGVLVLFGVQPDSALALVFAALALFAMDAVDGLAARKLGLASEFGEYFDKEVDAFFLLALCLMLYHVQRIGAWILIPGLLRYGFVFFLKWAKPPQPKEPRNRYGIAIYVGTMSVFIFCLSPMASWVDGLLQGLAGLATLMLCGSFADTLVRLYRTSDAGVKP